MGHGNGEWRRRAGGRVVVRTSAMLAAVIAGVFTGTGGASGTAANAETVPEGVQMLMKRGGIPAIFEPKFVPAEEAGLPDSAWVLGVWVDGEAHAYSLNLLNGHEVVNDVVGGRPIAAVW